MADVTKRVQVIIDMVGKPLPKKVEKSAEKYSKTLKEIKKGTDKFAQASRGQLRALLSVMFASFQLSDVYGGVVSKMEDMLGLTAMQEATFMQLALPATQAFVEQQMKVIEALSNASDEQKEAAGNTIFYTEKMADLVSKALPFILAGSAVAGEMGAIAGAAVLGIPALDDFISALVSGGDAGEAMQRGIGAFQPETILAKLSGIAVDYTDEWDSIVVTTEEKATAISDAIRDATKGMPDYVKTALDGIADNIEAAGSDIGTSSEDLAKLISDEFEKLPKEIKDFLEGTEGLSNKISQTLNNMGFTWESQNLANQIKQPFKDATTEIQGFLGELANTTIEVKVKFKPEELPSIEKPGLFKRSLFTPLTGLGGGTTFLDALANFFRGGLGSGETPYGGN